MRFAEICRVDESVILIEYHTFINSADFCRNLSILWEKPTGADYEVVIIQEEPGF